MRSVEYYRTSVLKTENQPNDSLRVRDNGKQYLSLGTTFTQDSMALTFVAASLHPKPSTAPPPLLFPKHKHLLKLHHSSSSSSSYSFRAFSQSEGVEGRVKEEDPPVSFSGKQLLHSLTNCFISFFLLVWKSFHSHISLPNIYIYMKILDIVGSVESYFL